MNLQGNKVLITGGGSGIGLALAKAWTRLGSSVVLVGRDSAKLQEAQRELPDAAVYVCDVGRAADVETLYRTVRTEHPDVNVLVNNAGIQRLYRLDGESDEALRHADAEIAVNLSGAIRLTALWLPLLRHQPSAAVVNITSGLAIAPKGSAPVYCATKAGLSVFTRALRYQMEGTNVRVFEAMAPLVDTAMTAGRGRGKISPETFCEELLDGIARDRAHMRIGKTKLLALIHRVAPSLACRMMRDS